MKGMCIIKIWKYHLFLSLYTCWNVKRFSLPHIVLFDHANVFLVHCSIANLAVSWVHLWTLCIYCKLHNYAFMSMYLNSPLTAYTADKLVLILLLLHMICCILVLQFLLRERQSTSLPLFPDPHAPSSPSLTEWLDTTAQLVCTLRLHSFTSKQLNLCISIW